VTIGEACRAQNVEAAKLLAELNVGRARSDGRWLSLAVVDAPAATPAAAEPEEGPCCPHCAGRAH
jgi:hypothetical protein